LNPLRPENAPDEWEKKALKNFDDGVKEVFSLEKIGSREYLRYMKPLRMEENCMRCHISNKNSIASIRGGININIPWSHYNEIFIHNTKRESISSTFVFLIGVIVIVIFRKRLQGIYDELLRTSERFVDMANEIPGVVYQCIKKPDGKRIFLFIGDHVSNIYPGLTSEDLYRDGNIISRFTHPDDRITLREAMDESIKNQSHFNHAYRLRHDDGKEIWVRSSSMPKVLEDSSVVWNGYVCDITYQIKAREDKIKIDQYLQQKQKLESLGVLAGGIAHDFNNILCVIFTYCGLIRRKSDNKEFIEIHSDKIMEASQRAANLCRQMLNYAGDKETPKTFLSFRKEVAGIATMTQETLSNKNIKILVEYNHEEDCILGDCSRIQQVVMNLLINAIEAIGDGEGNVNVMLENVVFMQDQTHHDFLGNTITAGKYICMTVADNGCGMDKETQARIFEPFYSTKFTGRGLGMSSILGIINSHDGAIQFSSAVGIGTTFKIYFPIVLKKDEKEFAAKDSEVQVHTVKGCILIVDDEETLRTAIGEMISIMKYEVLMAENGKRAVEIFGENMDKISLILLDRTMPIMNGLDAYHEIRKISSSVAIIFYSGDDMSNLINITAEDVHASCMQKPFAMKELYFLVDKMLYGK
jgi:signal transduction histidine kinase/CheY-like chemotaxis protein